MGAETDVFSGDSIDFPTYVAESPAPTPKVLRLIDALRTAHGVVIASPGYHGSVTGLVKNALDYIELLREDSPAYLDGRAVGLIACAQGWQAAVSTLDTLRSITHALRGWPTSLGVAFNTSTSTFSENDLPVEPTLARQLDALVEQVMEFSLMRHRACAESMAK